MYTLHTTCQVPLAPPCPSSLPLAPLRFPFFCTPTRVSVRCPIGHTGAGMCACGEGMPPVHSAARTPSQAPLGWGRVPPCTGPRQAGLPKNMHSHYHAASSTSARSLRAPLCKPQVNELLRPCSCRLRCLVRTQIRKRGAPRGRPLQRWRSFCLRLRARDVGNNM